MGGRGPQPPGWGPRHGLAELQQERHLVVLAGALAVRGAVVPAFSLMLQMPSGRVTVLLDHAGLEGHGLLEAGLELPGVVERQGVLQADVHVGPLAQHPWRP